MQATTLTERIADWHHGLSVDPDKRLVKNVALAGAHSRNGYRYAEASLQTAAPLYDQKPVFLDHAEDLTRPHSRSTRDLVGSIVNPRFEAGRIRGDIRLLETDSARTFLALVDSNAPGVGMSHVVLARRSADGATVEAIEDVLSVDAVVSPATTTTFRESTVTASAPRPIDDPAVPVDSIPASEESAAALGTQLATVTTHLEQLSTRLARLERQHEQEQTAHRLGTLLAESQLPAYALNPRFLEQLQSAGDDAARRELIRERLDLIHHAARPLPSSDSRSLNASPLATSTFIDAVKRR